jgi:hypothetical protein
MILLKRCVAIDYRSGRLCMADFFSREPCYFQEMPFAIANRIRPAGLDSQVHTPYQN